MTMAGGHRGDQGDLTLLLAELGQYLNQVRLYVSDPGPKAYEDIRHKMAYIGSLSVKIRNHNFDLELATRLDERIHRLYHCQASISGRLHRISELGLNVASQMRHLSHSSFLAAYDLSGFFDEIDRGLAMIRPALEQRKLKMVVALCRVEERLDALYADSFRRLIREMEEGLGQPGDRVTVLMIVHYLERIGDLILEIGEELLHLVLGENLHYSQYLALEAGLKASGLSGRSLAYPGEFQSIWSGRSGCRIGVVGGEEVGLAGGEPVVFKHGPSAKLEKELENLKIWSELWPGLPPGVRAFVPAEGGGEAALVLEYIQGDTLRDMFLKGPAAEAFKELTGALNLMAGLWRETRLEKEIRAGFAKQSLKRLGPVRALYPDLADFNGHWGAIQIRPFAELLEEALLYEQALPAPFTVRAHGDFNLSNVMRDNKKGSYRFIDLYRSRLSDYAQDLSVMTMSILRLPLSGAPARERLSRAAQLVWTFALDFAAQNHDPTLEARLSFGLARSYLTSARFETRRAVAARFLGYSRFLWEQLLDHGRRGRSWTDFKLDKRLLYV
jgi:Phosphate uptake regulator